MKWIVAIALSLCIVAPALALDACPRNPIVALALLNEKLADRTIKKIKTEARLADLSVECSEGMKGFEATKTEFAKVIASPCPCNPADTSCTVRVAAQVRRLNSRMNGADTRIASLQRRCNALTTNFNDDLEEINEDIAIVQRDIADLNRLCTLTCGGTVGTP